jgi:hypothetical protein
VRRDNLTDSDRARVPPDRETPSPSASQAAEAWKAMAGFPSAGKTRSTAPRAGRAAYTALLRQGDAPRTKPADAGPWLLLRDSTRRRAADS